MDDLSTEFIVSAPDKHMVQVALVTPDIQYLIVMMVTVVKLIFCDPCDKYPKFVLHEFHNDHTYAAVTST